MDYQALYTDVGLWIFEQQRQAQQLGFGSAAYLDWVILSGGELCDKYYNDNFVLKQVGFLWDHIDEALKKQGRGTIHERVKRNQNI